VGRSSHDDATDVAAVWPNGADRVQRLNPFNRGQRGRPDGLGGEDLPSRLRLLQGKCADSVIARTLNDCARAGEIFVPVVSVLTSRERTMRSEIANYS